ncbi:hypothetical protein MS3_00008398 [Schistosoma haematobium]|uniref:Uncharacterized protein n=2 Tax=Schistosoma haematobium TaxID=6185 RepID=A0A6A5DG65_SCHHA|nr:hypothetical protein MS3_00008398 [Schistosoma haematobium]KAH9581182.1 hypothetical protein MS3_00008398 [Schistosoma haematobium]
MSPPSFQLMPFWQDNIEAWFCYAEADLYEHSVNDTRAQFLSVFKALQREFNRYVTPSMFTSDVSEPYETLKRSILKRGDLTDRQRLDQLLNNIDPQHGSATDMLQRMREVIGQRTFDDGLFKHLFLSKLPQQVQTVLVSFQNNALDELAASADRILEIMKSSTTEEKPQTTQNDITELCHKLTRYLNFRNDRKRSHTPRRSTFRKRSVSRPREMDDPDCCWYHNQYGKSFRNCREPCNFPFSKPIDKCTPRESRQVDYISQFTSDIQHTSVANNVVADALSRITSLNSFQRIDLLKLAQLQKEDTGLQHELSSTTLKLHIKDRPIVTKHYRCNVFNTLHKLSYPGVRATIKLIAERFCWPDVREWARSCVSCQKSKVIRHNKCPLISFKTPDARFDHVHLDLVGPLPDSNGYSYLTLSLDDQKQYLSKTSLLKQWPAPSSNDVWQNRGRQFESELFRRLTALLGTTHFRTTAYHPKVNGSVEGFHRQLKASLSAANISQWTDAFPLILLGIRNAVKADIGYTTAQLVYGTTLRLPGELVDLSSSSMNMDIASYTNMLTNAMRSVTPVSTRPQSTVFVQPDLRYSTHVFVRRDSHRRPLESAYEGPFKVFQREPKYYIIDKNGTNDSISIDRLKEAYLEGIPIHVDFPSLQSNDTAPTLIIPQPTANTHNDTSAVSENKLKTTRSRRVRFPKHLNDYCMVPYIKERQPDAAKPSGLSEECLPTTNSLGLNSWPATS